MVMTCSLSTPDPEIFSETTEFDFWKIHNVSVSWGPFEQGLHSLSQIKREGSLEQRRHHWWSSITPGVWKLWPRKTQGCYLWRTHLHQQRWMVVSKLKLGYVIHDWRRETVMSFCQQHSHQRRYGTSRSKRISVSSFKRVINDHAMSIRF